MKCYVNKKKIKKAMLVANITGVALANKANVSNVTIISVLKRKATSVKTCNKIANALGVSVLDLFTVEG